MATVSLLLRSVSKQNCADGFACRMGCARGLQERAILGLGKHGHARSVYRWHGSLGRRCGVLSNYFDLLFVMFVFGDELLTLDGVATVQEDNVRH